MDEAKIVLGAWKGTYQSSNLQPLEEATFCCLMMLSKFLRHGEIHFCPRIFPFRPTPALCKMEALPTSSFPFPLIFRKGRHPHSTGSSMSINIPFSFPRFPFHRSHGFVVAINWECNICTSAASKFLIKQASDTLLFQLPSPPKKGRATRLPGQREAMEGSELLIFIRSLNHPIPGRCSWGESKPKALLGVLFSQQLNGRRNSCSSQAGEMLDIPSQQIKTLVFQEEISFFPEDESMEKWIWLVMPSLNLYGNWEKLSFKVMKAQSLRIKIKGKP